MRDWNLDKEKLRLAVESTLENIAFCIVNEVEHATATPASEMVSSFISCTIGKSYKVAIALSIHEAYLDKIVSDLYPDAESIGEYLQDTLDEFINTVAGIFFRSIEYEIGAFQLSIPYHEHSAISESAVKYYFLLDDTHPLTITIS